jgi:hypothetical protein
VTAIGMLELVLTSPEGTCDDGYSPQAICRIGRGSIDLLSLFRRLNITPMLDCRHLSSPKGHYFVLVATDYFTKWTEAVTLKNMTHNEVIEFVTEHIIHRFSIPHMLTRIKVHLLHQTRYEILLNYIRSNCLIHLHIILKLMAKLSQATTLWSSLLRIN